MMGESDQWVIKRVSRIISWVKQRVSIKRVQVQRWSVIRIQIRVWIEWTCEAAPPIVRGV